MIQWKWVCVALALCFLGLGGTLPADEPAASEPMRVGMVGSLLTDVPQPLVQFLSFGFGAMMKDFTGLDGKLVAGGTSYEVAKNLCDKKLDVAVFHSFEFGWAQQQYPDLRPLMVAVGKNRTMRAHLVVRGDSDAKSFHDIKGKDLALPRRSKEICRLYLERSCCECGQTNAKSFCNQVVASANMEVALDDICRGKVQCAVIDSASLEWYETLKPGCFARLKVLKNSEASPPACIAYRQGALDEATLKKFRDGMIAANQNERGRAALDMFQIHAFEPVPADYAQTVADIIKAFPPPQSPDKVSQK